MPCRGANSRASNTPTIVERNQQASRIRALNDQLRVSFSSGMVVISAGVRGLGHDAVIRIIVGVRDFDTFDGNNDPYLEHDFGALAVDEHQIFWKIDYYDKRLENGLEDPSSPEVTTLVLTIMLASEY